MWLNQNFLLTEEIQPKNGSLDVTFLSLRTGNPLVIRMDQSGEVSRTNLTMSIIDRIHPNLLPFQTICHTRVLQFLCSSVTVILEKIIEYLDGLVLKIIKIQQKGTWFEVGKYYTHVDRICLS